MKEYSARRGIRPALILMRADRLGVAPEAIGRKLLWKGRLYRDSESRFFQYLKDLRDGRLDTFVLMK